LHNSEKYRILAAVMSAGYQTIIEHYEQCLARHGDTHLGVDWPNAEDADRRYRVMLDVIREPRDQAVMLMDFGCGAGHLLEHLRRHGRSNVRYVGVDASARFIDLSRQKFPGVEFYCTDVLADGATLPRVDYVVMNGVLTEKRGLSFDEMLVYAWRLLPRVFELARFGMAFNVMSKHVDWERDDLFHLPYDMLAAFLKAELSRHFLFRADYGLYEYTAYVYREPTKM
jgi:SAM-dependent methyltransferase